MGSFTDAPSLDHRDGWIKIGKQAFVTAAEQPDVCQHGARKLWGACRQRAVAFVVFGAAALPWGVPIGVPMAVCEKHFLPLWSTYLTEREMHPDRLTGNLINNCERYISSEFA